VTGDPVEIRRIGPLSPLELQVRRVETRAAFLRHELHKLEDLVDAGARMTSDQGAVIVELLEDVARVAGRIARAHPDPEPRHGG
jgi:hypothetical protein